MNVTTLSSKNNPCYCHTRDGRIYRVTEGPPLSSEIARYVQEGNFIATFELVHNNSVLVEDVAIHPFELN